MIEIATAIAVIKGLSTTVGLIDKVYDSFRRFTDTGQAGPSRTTSYYEGVVSSADNRELIHTTNGQPAQRITAAELAGKLSEGDLRHLRAVERALEINVRLWDEMVAEIPLEPNKLTAARYKLMQEDLAKNVANDLKGVLDFLCLLGFTLQDHYGAARDIAMRYSSGANR
jgi:hypothetical protein